MEKRTTIKRKNGRYESVIDNDEAEQVAGRYEDLKEKYHATDEDVENALAGYGKAKNGN